MSSVLFVCTGNYYRSRFAEILFRHRSRERGLDLTVFSRGLRVDPERNPGNISSLARKRLAELGVDVPPQSAPRALTLPDLHAATLTILLSGVEHRPMLASQFPEFVTRVECWEVGDVPLVPAAEALSQLERLVESRLAQMAPKEPKLGESGSR